MHPVTLISGSLTNNNNKNNQPATCKLDWLPSLCSGRV